MYIIGLTGGIASGKSTVSRMLAELGACIIDADKIARAIVEPHKPAWQDIVDYFGADILLADGTINRNMLGNKIFNNGEARKQLEEFMHPRIKQQIQDDIVKMREQGCEVLVLDVPLLYEVGWQTMADEVWVVYVNEETQLTRLMERNHLPYEQAVARIRSQMNLTAKSKLADVIIDNNSDFSSTRKQVRTRWKQVIQLAASIV